MIHFDSLRSLYSGHEAHQSAEHVRLLYWIHNGTLPFSAALLGFSLVQSLLSRERVAMAWDQSHDTHRHITARMLSAAFLFSLQSLKWKSNAGDSADVNSQGV